MTCKIDLGIPVDQIRSFGTGGLGTMSAAGSYAYSAIVDPQSRRGVVGGWLTHERGVGVFFPKAGKEGRTGQVLTQIDFGQFQVDPGRERVVDEQYGAARAQVASGAECHRVIDVPGSTVDPRTLCTVERHFLTIHRKEILAKE